MALRHVLHDRSSHRLEGASSTCLVTWLQEAIRRIGRPRSQPCYVCVVLKGAAHLHRYMIVASSD